MKLSVSTCAVREKLPELTIESICEAIKEIKSPPLPQLQLKICKKHWKMVKKELTVKPVSDFWMGNLNGIAVIIKPYLKKARLVPIQEPEPLVYRMNTTRMKVRKLLERIK